MHQSELASLLAGQLRRAWWATQGARAALVPRRWYSDLAPDFLIVGLQKAGTYWLSALLNAHPKIASTPTHPGAADGEGHFFDVIGQASERPEWAYDRLRVKHDRFFADLASDVVTRPLVLDRLKRRYCAWVRRAAPPEAELAGEKTPEYVFYLELIEEVFPGVKKIVVLRNPADRIVSFHHHQIRKGREAPGPIRDDEVRAYCHRIAMEYGCLVRHEGSLHFTRYEGLLRDSWSELSRLLAYLGISTDQEAVQRMVDVASFERVTGRQRGHSDSSSHYRKGVAGEGGRELTAVHLRVVRSLLEEPTRGLSEKCGIDLSRGLPSIS